MRRILRGRHPLLGAGIALVAALAVFAVLILADDDPPALAEEELPAGCAPGTPYVKCTYMSSTKLSVNSMVTALEAARGGRELASSTPVWIEAWGGQGARGASGDGVKGALGGDGGYATTVSTVGALTGKQLYLYVGASGSKHANYSGQGGASTILSTQAISQIDDLPGGLQVVAGGGGGGPRGSSRCSASRGGAGGVAIATTGTGNRTASGQSGQGTVNQGGGGNPDETTAAAGGAAGDRYASAGTAGLGGPGGQGSQGSTVGWVDLNAVDSAAAGWTTGAGGRGRGGGGGGGLGGGGGGGSAREDCAVGAGGGGSWASHYAAYDPDSPQSSKQAEGASSTVVLTFNLG